MITVRVLPEAMIDDPDLGSYIRHRVVEYAIHGGEMPHRGTIELSGDLADMLAGPVSVGPVVGGTGPTIPLGDVIAAARDSGTLDAAGVDIADILEAIE